MSAVGIDNPLAHLAGDMVSYVNPVTGAISSGIDAYEAAKKGNWGEAAVNTLFAIPFIGGAAKGVACRKRHTLNAFAVHIVHRITTAAAHADDLDDTLHFFFGDIEKRYQITAACLFFLFWHMFNL
jgi:hypothetical protein